MSRTRERRSLWRLFRENTKTALLNGIFHHIRDDSDSVDQMLTKCHTIKTETKCDLDKKKLEDYQFHWKMLGAYISGPSSVVCGQ